MIKNNLILSFYVLCFTACASWPWKYTEQHGKLSSGSIFSQINDAMNDNEKLSSDNKCTSVPDAGLCKGSFEKYFFNSETEKCDSFNWGGCNGLIPFETLSECINTCE